MKKPTPVILGNDLNAYSVAISFHARFGVKSHVFGRYPCGITQYSDLTVTHIVPNLTEPKAGVFVMEEFLAEHPTANAVMIPAADWYMELAELNRERWENSVRFCQPERSLRKKLSDKAEFYGLCEQEGIPFPETVVLRSPVLTTLPWGAVLKPSDSTEYWAHTFDGMRKVWYPESAADANEIIRRIYDAGYGKSVIIQRKLNAERASVLTALILPDGTLYAAACADVLLEEKGITSEGNYAALLIRKPEEIDRKLCAFACSVGYRGICNFDILYENGKAYVLELNPRQGRSCDYLRAAGVDMAGFMAGQPKPRREPFSQEEAYWRCVSDKTVLELMKNEEKKQKVLRLKSEGKAYSPFSYLPDISHGIVRKMYTKIHILRRSTAIRKQYGVKK